MANEVFITEPGTRIVARKGSVIIMGRDGNKQVLSPNTEEVIIATSRASITTKAIRILATKGANLVILNPLGDPVAIITSPIINKTVITRIKQYELFLNNEIRFELARRIIACKIENQARLIRYLAKSRRETSLNDIAYSISSMATQLMSIETNKLNPEIIESIEAQAANKYWDAITSLLPSQLGFHGRNPRWHRPDEPSPKLRLRNTLLSNGKIPNNGWARPIPRHTPHNKEWKAITSLRHR